MAAGVLLQDGAVLQAPPSPAAVLAERSGGAYTSALVLGGQHIVDWELHLERLASNIECLHEERPPSFGALVAWCERQGRPMRQLVRQLVEPQVAVALTMLEVGPQAQQPEEQGNGERLERRPQQEPIRGGGGGGAVMLVVVLSEAPAQQEAAGSAAAVAVDAGAVEGGAPVSVAVYCKPFELPPAGQEAAGKVVVRGAPRQWARAKHCEWVLQRRALEAAKPPDAADVILVDEDGGLLEGLVTNVYVIAEAPSSASSGAPPAQAPAAAAVTAAGGEAVHAPGLKSPGAPDLSRYELQTAVGSGARVLPGTLQRRVLEAAAALGLRVREGPPRCSERATWREAFVSNSLRGLQPIGTVAFWPGGSSPEWEQQMSGSCGAAGGGAGGGCGPVTRLLRQQVARLQQRTPASALLRAPS